MRMGARAFVIALLCCTSLLGFFASPAAAANSGRVKQKVLQYYVHESLGGPNATVVAVASQNGNLSFTGFGYTFSADNVLKDGGNENSTVIGFAAALGTTSNHPSVSHITVTHALNSTILGVGNLEIAGNLDFSMPIKPSQLVVSGGTGDFKFYRGVIDVVPVWVAYPFTLYQATATLRY